MPLLQTDYHVAGRLSDVHARPVQNAPFCPITASSSNFGTEWSFKRYPRNIQYIPPVKIFAFLVLEQNWTFFKGLHARAIDKGIASAFLIAKSACACGGLQPRETGFTLRSNTLVSCHLCNVAKMTVIPAEAGIQKRRSSQKYWIPTFVGMTSAWYDISRMTRH